jgi:putative endonuclease
MKPFAVYILASRRNGTLYIGVTNDVVARVHQHREADEATFTGRYQVHRLVYVEYYKQVQEAIAREKQLKRWKREWKLRLIERANPEWVDLYGLAPV